MKQSNEDPEEEETLGVTEVLEVIAGAKEIDLNKA